MVKCKNIGIKSPMGNNVGKALKFYASTRVRMNKVKVQSGDPITADDGIKVNCSILKNRFCNGKNPYMKCTYYAKYNEGIDNLATLPEMLSKYNVVRNAGAWIRIENEDGDVETIEGIVCKWNGKNALLKCLKENPLLLEELNNRLASAMNGIEHKGIAMSDEEVALAKADSKVDDKEIEEIS